MMKDAEAPSRAQTPLAGVRVLDLTQALAGPYGTMVLGDLGADVIKIELPERGDDSRHWGPPFVGSSAAYYYGINRNKRSVAVNLKSEAGKTLALELVKQCDVVMENWRPGVTARLGLDYESVRVHRPDVVYTSLSAFGAGEDTRAGYDQVIQGMSGLMSVTGSPDGPPMKMGVGITDITSGMFAAIATLGALHRREQTGEGSYVDVAMHDSAVALLAYQATRYLASGVAPTRGGNVHNSIAPYAAFETKDGYVNVCAANEIQWNRLCGVLELEYLLDDPRFATNGSRTDHKDELYPVIEEAIRAKTTDALMRELEEAGVPAGPVRSLDEVFSDPSVLARGMKQSFSTADGTMSVPGIPWRYNGVAGEMVTPPPGRGEYTRTVLEGLGYSDDVIDELSRAGDIECA
jgi:formyl-CoA transferase